MTDLVAARIEQMAQSVFPLVPSSEHALQALQAAMNNERRQQVPLLPCTCCGSEFSDMLLWLLLMSAQQKWYSTGKDLCMATPVEKGFAPCNNAGMSLGRCLKRTCHMHTRHSKQAASKLVRCKHSWPAQPNSLPLTCVQHWVSFYSRLRATHNVLLGCSYNCFNILAVLDLSEHVTCRASSCTTMCWKPC